MSLPQDQQVPFRGKPTVLVPLEVDEVVAAEQVVRFEMRLNDDAAGKLVPLFMGVDPAQRFLLALGDEATGITPFQLPDFNMLEHLLVELKALGTTHVHFNPMPESSPPPVPIDEVIDSLRNRPKS